jgi:hypothetical protein
LNEVELAEVKAKADSHVDPKIVGASFLFPYEQRAFSEAFRLKPGLAASAWAVNCAPYDPSARIRIKIGAWPLHDL